MEYDKINEECGLAYLNAGLCILPASIETKFPLLDKWDKYKSEMPSVQAVKGWMDLEPDALSVVCGKVSGNLEVLDFDGKGEMFTDWLEIVEEQAPHLIDSLVIEQSPSEGYHVPYRCEEPVCGSIKLAERRIYLDNNNTVTFYDKEYVPRKDSNGDYYVDITFIETRGEGGLIIAAPSAGYTLVQGLWTDLPVLTAEEREILLGAAWSLTEIHPEPEGVAKLTTPCEGLRPGDDFNAREDIRPFLENHGWRKIRDGINEHWSRPGKKTGTSATLKDDVFYCFSSNAYPFEADKAYSKFGVYTQLEHNGDFNRAAQDLRAKGYGDQIRTEGTEILNNNKKFEFSSLLDLTENYPSLKPEIIHGLLRQGETMNIVAAPKTGKSWLVLDLALAIATGKKWLDTFKVKKGNVLIIDNELHPETSTHRLKNLVNAHHLEISDVSENLAVANLRGKLRDIDRLTIDLKKSITKGQFDIIIIDAWYRVLPKGCDENDNAGITQLYNQIDNLADDLGCSFILIHHTSKGNQTLKSVSDVGSGAGSQSRASDTHLVLRKHAEENVVVLDGVVRSNPAIDPICVRRNFPLWEPDASLDPEDLENPNKKSSSKEDKIEPVKFSTEGFVECFLSEEPIQEDILNEEAGNEGVSKRNVKGFINSALAKKMIFPWILEYGLKGYATVEQLMVERTEVVQDISEKRLMVEEMIQDSSNMTVKEIASTCEVSVPYVYKIKNMLKE